MRAAGHPPSPTAAGDDGGAMPRDAAWLGPEPDQRAARAVLADFGQRVAADEVTLVKLHRPAQAGLIRVDRLVHVVPVKAKGGFEAGGVTGAQNLPPHPPGAARPEDRSPPGDPPRPSPQHPQTHLPL